MMRGERNVELTVIQGSDGERANRGGGWGPTMSDREEEGRFIGC